MSYLFYKMEFGKFVCTNVLLKHFVIVLRQNAEQLLEFLYLNKQNYSSYIHLAGRRVSRQDEYSFASYFKFKVR